MNKKLIAAAKKHLKEENKNYPDILRQLSSSEMLKGGYVPPGIKEAWRSKKFLVQIFDEGEIERMSVIRSSIDDNGQWKCNISWDDLQALKFQCGRGDKCAVELYPSDENIVNVANMRHIWILPEVPEFCWRRSK